jgi:3-oxoacyl-[acyl-carrier protein] reductase
MLLKNKTAIITGSNKGIGKCILETFVKEGANVLACIRTESEEFTAFINELGDSYGKTITAINLDLENSDSIKKAIKTIMSMKIPIDILVNNAGVAAGSIFQMTSQIEIEKMLRVNFIGQIQLSQGISRLMIRNKKGSIVNIASVAGIHGNPGTLSYGSSKAAFIFATKNMAAELGASNIRANSISPNVTKTEMYHQMDKKARQKLIESSALKRAGEPSEIANVALFLGSDLSSYMTGQNLVVDGGIFV